MYSSASLLFMPQLHVYVQGHCLATRRMQHRDWQQGSAQWCPTCGHGYAVQGQGLALQRQQQHRAQAAPASLRTVAQAATMEAPARTTSKGPSEAAPELGTQKPTVSAP